MSWKIRMITEKATGNGTIQGYTPSQAVVTVKNVHCHKNCDLNSWIVSYLGIKFWKIHCIIFVFQSSLMYSFPFLCVCFSDILYLICSKGQHILIFFSPVFFIIVWMI